MPVAKGKISNCNSSGRKFWDRDRETFERIGLCRGYGLRERDPLAGDLYGAIRANPLRREDLEPLLS